MTGAYAPAPGPNPAAVPPRYCNKHDTSEKRVKGEPRECTCNSCGIKFTSTYTEVTLCSMCSDQRQQCLICGGEAPKAGNYLPQNTIGNGNLTGGPQGKENREQLPPSPPQRQSSTAGPPAGRAPDPYGNLQPTDSIPVMQSHRLPINKGAMAAAPASPPPQKAPPQQQAPAARRAPPPNTKQVFAGRPQGNRRQEADDYDDNPFSLGMWLRRLNCGDAAGFFRRRRRGW